MKLEKKIAKELEENSLSLCTAESCTGGLVAGRITKISGASGCFEGGFITYSNKAKSALLGVPGDLIERYGAVSDQTARAMAEGARAKLNTDIAVSVTGIAGPGGGTPDKPVGTVFIGLATSKRTVVREFHFSGTRHVIRKKTTDEALQFVVDYIEGRLEE
ncbi:MAG: CinA family protein [Syntrophorhabdaceae bacterium]